MVENPYQLLNVLECNELYVLLDKEHFQGNKMKSLLEKKCEKHFGDLN